MSDRDTFAFKPLLEADASDDFVAAFRGVLEWTGPSGTRRYRHTVIRRLAEALAGRNFGPVVFQLCHFIPAAASVAHEREGYWALLHSVDRANPEQFRNLFRSRTVDASPAGLKLDAGAITWTATDAPFKIWFRAMPLLSALHDFLWSEVPEARAVFDELSAAPSDLLAGDAANQVQRALDAYLNAHQIMRQGARKMQRIREFLSARAKDRKIEIGDNEIFEFWRKHVEAGGGDFAKFRSVLEAFALFLNIRARAERRADAGPDPEVLGLIAADDPIDVDPDWQSPLAEFDDPATTRKYLGSAENRRRVARVAAIGPVGLELALSVLRAEVFGDKQDRLSNALRQRLATTEIEAFVLDAAEGDYRQRREAIAGVLTALQDPLRAAAWEAYQTGSRAETGGDGGDGDDFDGQAVPTDNVVAFPDKTPELESETAQEMDSRRFDAALVAAEEAFVRMRHQRSAWRADSNPAADTEEEWQSSFVRLGALVQLRALLRQFLERFDRLDRGDPDLSTHHANDHEQFGTIFKHMYGAGR